VRDIVHLVTVPAVGAHYMAGNLPSRALKRARKRQGWPSFGDGENGGALYFLRSPIARAGMRIMGSNKMATRKKSVEGIVITKARTHAEQMLNQLVESASRALSQITLTF
jgi:hypothetical protein